MVQKSFLHRHRFCMTFFWLVYGLNVSLTKLYMRLIYTKEHICYKTKS